MVRELKSVRGEPTWEVARWYPLQGYWSEEDYFALNGNHHIEFADGTLEVLPMPTTSHQLLVAYLFTALQSFVKGKGLGTVLFSGVRVRVRKHRYCEPDIVFMLARNRERIGERFWRGADLVMEVVSGGKEDRRRDLDEKPLLYARAKIHEYWIVDPKKKSVKVLRLNGKEYAIAGEYKGRAHGASVLLPSFTIDVSELFARPTSRGNGSHKSD
jgi:Uma2 family endonuclease